MMSCVLHVCSEHSPSVTIAATLKHAKKAIHQLQPLLRHAKKEVSAPITDGKAVILSTSLQGGISAQGDDLAATSSGEGIAEGLKQFKKSFLNVLDLAVQSSLNIWSRCIHFVIFYKHYSQLQSPRLQDEQKEAENAVVERWKDSMVRKC